MTLEERYREALVRHDYASDTAQHAALAKLQRLCDELASATGVTRGMTARVRSLLSSDARRTPRGLYLYGPVGTGKTFLMDLLTAELGARAKRFHFHRFMQDIHERLRNLDAGHTVDPLRHIAVEMARESVVLCLDELYVQDIGDAMILGRLFSSLHAHGMSLVVTSNCLPAELYAGGLQRARFLPTISLLKQITELVHVSSGIDYRLRQLQRAPLHILQSARKDHSALEARLLELTGAVSLKPGQIEIAGRTIAVRHRDEHSAWFDFDVLCVGARSTADYISIANQFQLIVVSDVTVMDQYAEDSARRFIALVDELYDHHTILLLGTVAPLVELYQGRRLQFEWQRTASRLVEMQSHAYLSDSRTRS